MNKFSIIVPFYNTCDELIYNCEESLINQSYDNTEIIFVNDGSQRNYNFDSKVKLIDASHLGVSNARNVGIDNSTGDYILFVDSDDALTLNACREFNNFLMLNPKADIVFCRNFINSGGKISKNYFGYDDSFRVTNKQELLRSIFLKNTNYSSIDTPWSKIYSRQFLNDNSIRFNTKLTNGEDGIFNYESIFLARSLYYLNSANYIYNVNSNSVCNTFYDDLDIKFLNLILEYEKIFNKYNIYDENFKLFVLRIYDRLLRKYYSHYSEKEIKDKMHYMRSIMDKYILHIDESSLSSSNLELVRRYKKEGI